MNARDRRAEPCGVVMVHARAREVVINPRRTISKLRGTREIGERPHVLV